MCVFEHIKNLPQIMLRNRIFWGRISKIINESANFWNLLPVALNININIRPYGISMFSTQKLADSI